MSSFRLGDNLADFLKILELLLGNCLCMLAPKQIPQPPLPSHLAQRWPPQAVIFKVLAAHGLTEPAPEGLDKSGDFEGM